MEALITLSAILFVAALPIILVFVFLELNAEKQAKTEGKTLVNDGQRKLAKGLAWGLFAVLAFFVIGDVFDHEGNSNIPRLLKVIGSILHFLF